MPDVTTDNLHRLPAHDQTSEQKVNEGALVALQKDASSKDLLSSLASKQLLAKEPAYVPHSKSYLETGINSVTSLVITNDANRDQVNHYAGEFVKTASLFAGGKVGIVGAAISYGLDQAHPEDSWKHQAADFALGAAKGETLKGMFSVIGARNDFAPTKGALMGLGSGTIDEVFKRETFTDPSSLNDRLRKNAFNPAAILTNAAVFTAGEGLFTGLNIASKGALTENKMLSGMVMGGSFGFVNGSFGEASRQYANHEDVNFGKIAWKGLLDGGVAAAGAGAGMKISDPVFQAKVKDLTYSALDRVGLSPYPSAREFVVTGGIDQLDQFSNEKTRAALTTVREVRNILGWERVGPEKRLLIQHSEQKSDVPIPKLADLLASCNPEDLGNVEKASHLFPKGSGPVSFERGAENHIRLAIGDQAPQWKNSTGATRIMLGGPETKLNAMAPLMIGDPNDPDGAASKQAWDEFSAELAKGKKIGLDGISSDVWWGIAEPKEGQFKWNYYDKLSSKIIGAGLNWVPIESFHECGGNVGDNVNVPVPFWVWNKISSQIPGSSPDVGKFKSEQGHVSSEYVQFWADKQAAPLYKNFMTEFGNHFAGKAQHISEINISLGPAGEARYPSYNHHDENVGYPTRGAMQADSDLAKADFKRWTLEKYKDFDGVNKAWGGHVENIEPPVDADGFFKNNIHKDTQYGRDVIDWYNGTLINHIKTVMGEAFDVYGNNPAFKDTTLGMKLPGIHWGIGHNAGDQVILGDRLPEINAGLIRTSANDWQSDDLGRGYRPLLTGIKELMDSKPNGKNFMLHFTALEMPDGQDGPAAQAMPYTLANWVGREAQHQGIPLKGENALAGTLGGQNAWDIMTSHLNLPGNPGYYRGITLLRLGDVVNSDTASQNVQKITEAAKTHGHANPAQRNAS